MLPPIFESNSSDLAMKAEERGNTMSPAAPKIAGTVTVRRTLDSKCDNEPRGSVVKKRIRYKGYVIEAQANELRDGGFSVEFYLEEHDASGVTVTQFYVPSTFPTQEAAFEAAIQAGRQKIDMGFEKGSVVVNG